MQLPPPPPTPLVFRPLKKHFFYVCLPLGNKTQLKEIKKKYMIKGKRLPSLIVIICIIYVYNRKNPEERGDGNLKHLSGYLMIMTLYYILSMLLRQPHWSMLILIHQWEYRISKKKDNGLIEVVQHFAVPTNLPASFLLKFFITCNRLVWVVASPCTLGCTLTRPSPRGTGDLIGPLSKYPAVLAKNWEEK